MDVREYVGKRNENGERFDPELRFYERCGVKIDKVLPESMTGFYADPESLNYCVPFTGETPTIPDAGWNKDW